MERVVIIKKPVACPYRGIADNHDMICIKTNKKCMNKDEFPTHCILKLAKIED